LAKVFLSYAREDASAAKQLAECIGRAGHQVWWDHQIEGGSRFSAEIDRELKNCDAVVVIWTKASIESPWVQDEAAEGRDSGRLVPVIFGTDKPPLGFRQFQSVDFGNWDGASDPPALEALIRAIAQKGGEPQTAPLSGKLAGKAPELRQSICVLPFANMSGDPEQEYFSDGITEDIITDLSKVSALSVVARNTAFTLKGQSLDVKEVAQKFEVDHVLEGSVRKSGNRVRITAQLIDGKKGDHLWADRYDRDLTDIFAIQDEISKEIVAALRVTLLPEEKRAIETRGTSSVEAYNLYLMARQQWVTGDFSDVRRDETIARICRQALSFDPNYAQAWALMALAQSNLRLLQGKEVDALPAAERALAINPAIAEAHCVMAQLVEEQGKHDEALAEMEEALRLDPESWEVNREAARLMFRRGRVKEAIPLFEKAASLMQNDWHNPMMLTTCYQSVGDQESLLRCARLAVERAEMAVAKDPTNAQALAGGSTALALIGEERRAKDWIERALLVDPDNIIMRYNLACALIARLEDRDRAIEVMEPFFDRVGSVTFIRHLEADPDMDSIRDEPRFKEMLAAAKGRLGMTEMQVTEAPPTAA
jgi:adenylate cyclase